MTPRSKDQKNHTAAPLSLLSEIELLRKVIEMVGRQADEAHPLPDMLRVLDGLGKGITRLAALLKAERQFDGEQDALAALNEALAEVIDEMGLEGQK